MIYFRYFPFTKSNQLSSSIGYKALVMLIKVIVILNMSLNLAILILAILNRFNNPILDLWLRSYILMPIFISFALIEVLSILRFYIKSIRVPAKIVDRTIPKVQNSGDLSYDYTISFNFNGIDMICNKILVGDSQNVGDELGLYVDQDYPQITSLAKIFAPSNSFSCLFMLNLISCFALSGAPRI
jgi:hypothetical protein